MQLWESHCEKTIDVSFQTSVPKPIECLHWKTMCWQGMHLFQFLLHQLSRRIGGTQSFNQGSLQCACENSVDHSLVLPQLIHGCIAQSSCFFQLHSDVFQDTQQLRPITKKSFSISKCRDSFSTCRNDSVFWSEFPQQVKKFTGDSPRISFWLHWCFSFDPTAQQNELKNWKMWLHDSQHRQHPPLLFITLAAAAWFVESCPIIWPQLPMSKNSDDWLTWRHVSAEESHHALLCLIEASMLRYANLCVKSLSYVIVHTACWLSPCLRVQRRMSILSRGSRKPQKKKNGEVFGRTNFSLGRNKMTKTESIHVLNI